jgi:hypothetical protein
MPPTSIILWSAVRYFIGLSLGYGVAKGVFTKSQADAALPQLVSWAVLILTFIGLVGWSYFQKQYMGWVARYPQLKVLENFSPKPKVIPPVGIIKK